ncbi:transposase ISGsu3 [Mesorhizobium sp. LSJC268A00]|nr:transposase ISGsu3 [Mesorhizobium sp. LSJC268A00]
MIWLGAAQSSVAPNSDDVNVALAALERDLAALYSPMGRPSIPPEKLLRAILLQAFYSILSERLLMERLEYDLLFRWFVGIDVE